MALLLKPHPLIYYPPTIQAYAEFMGFVHIVNDAVKGKRVSDDIPASPAIDKLLGLLSTLNTWIDEIPPTDQPQRFGNKSFRTWHERLTKVSLFVYF